MPVYPFVPRASLLFFIAMRHRTLLKNRSSDLSAAFDGFRGAVVAVSVISGIINLLALTGSLYMLQVYDRVLSSHSVPTLVSLSVLMYVLYAF
jgi:ABC-type protease/lipase transport system fused ATPase/permease subunit